MEPDNRPRRGLRASPQQAIQGGLAMAGGLGLLALQALGAIPFLGFLAGAAMAYGGYRMLQPAQGRHSGDTLQGMSLVVLGVLTAAAGLPVLKAIAGFVLGGAGIGLLVFGAWRLVNYWRHKERL
jgi:hypothetical protein